MKAFGRRPAPLLALFLFALVALGASACGTKCNNFTNERPPQDEGVGSDMFKSSFNASECSDNNTYAVRCSREEVSHQFACTCSVGATAGKSFTQRTGFPRNGFPESSIEMANDKCGWNMKRQ